MIYASLNLFFFMSVSVGDGLSLKPKDQGQVMRTRSPVAPNYISRIERRPWKSYNKNNDGALNGDRLGRFGSRTHRDGFRTDSGRASVATDAPF
jgi:hypothetical protein